MTASLTSLMLNDASAQALLGSNPTRFYPAGEAPQKVVTPYVVWQQVGGQPLNSMDAVCDYDAYQIRVDVYADSPAAAWNAFLTLRTILETETHITSSVTESKDPNTNHFKISFEMSWWEARP